MIDNLDHPTLLIICSFLDDICIISLTSSCYHLYLLRKWIEYKSEAKLDKIINLGYIEKFENIVITDNTLSWYFDNINNLRAKRLVFQCKFVPETRDEIPSSASVIIIHECFKNKINGTLATDTMIFRDCNECFGFELNQVIRDSYRDAYLWDTTGRRKYNCHEWFHEPRKPIFDFLNNSTDHPYVIPTWNGEKYFSSNYQSCINSHLVRCYEKLKLRIDSESSTLKSKNKKITINTKKKSRPIPKYTSYYEKNKIRSQIPKIQKSSKKNWFICKQPGR